jgi:hypothetical protein
MVKNRYWLLTTVCNVGKLGSVLLLLYGLVSIFLAPTSYTPVAITIGTAIASYITCESALVLVAIEKHARASARLLRIAHGSRREEDDE